ncbi:Hypothetical protein CINCED_3A025670 [Cinara cedri]|uniref:VASP tetramerisation domain-containing protein n=1 Tax=Cinara cedri TaxID=506608 RepID=A0A5E4MBK6_9HEMI|nr:Hypothetical protein CINCED_3A025670 [Cinara cedri]
MSYLFNIEIAYTGVVFLILKCVFNVFNFFRTMTKEDNSTIIQDRRMSQQNQITSTTNGSTLPPMIQQLPSSGHHRTSSAPPAPIPPPPPGMFNLTPPQPPPMPSSNGDPDHSEPVVDQTSSLAVQLQAARLKRTNKQHPTENSGSSTSSSGSGTLGRNANGSQTGMACMMNEMARTLARRRAAVEKKEIDYIQIDESLSPCDKKNLNRNDSQKNSLNGCESPKLGRKQLSATSTEDLITTKSFGENCISNLSLDLETFKQDILREIRKELNRMKSDIIESVKVEISKR